MRGKTVFVSESEIVIGRLTVSLQETDIQWPHSWYYCSLKICKIFLTTFFLGKNLSPTQSCLFLTLIGAPFIIFKLYGKSTLFSLLVTYAICFRLFAAFGRLRFCFYYFVNFFAILYRQSIKHLYVAESVETSESVASGRLGACLSFSVLSKNNISIFQSVII